LFIVLPFLTFAQTETNERATAKGPWVLSLLLRKGLETKDDKDKPAVFSLTWPKDGKANSYLVNAGLGLNLNHIKKGKSILDITPSFVFNRNNQIKKEQHNYKSLVSVNWQFGKEDTSNHCHQYVLLFPTVQHMWNRIDTSRSFFTTLYGTWMYKSDNTLFALNNYRNFGKSGLLYYIGPIVGLEYQDRYNVKNASTKGSITRFYWAMDVRLAIKRGNEANQALGFKRFEAALSYAQRHELGSNLPVKEGIIHLFKTEFSFFPANTDDVSLALSYNEGQDPIAAIEKQNFWQLAFKLKLTYLVKK